MLKRFKKLELHGLLKAGVASILLAVPLYPKFPLLRVPGTFVTVRIEDFLILGVSLVWFLTILPNLKDFFQNKVNKAIFSFLIISLLSVISGIWVTRTVVPHLGLLHLLRRVEYFLPFFIGMAAVKSEKDLAFYVKTLILVFYLVFLYGFGQKYLGWPVVTTQNFESSKGIALLYTPGAHLPATFAGHYDLASFLVLTLPLMFVFLFGKVKLEKVPLKTLSFLAIGVGFWLLVNSVSRISFVAYLISVSTALFLLKKFKILLAVVVISVILAGFSGSLVARYTRVIEVGIKQLMLIKPKEVFAQEPDMGVFEDRSTSIRLNIEWPRALRAFVKNPILGTGLSSITLATDNDYLRALGEIGILGLLAFILIFWQLIRKLLVVFPFPQKLSLSQAYLLGMISALPGVFLNALFIDIFEASKFAIIFWLMMGLAYGSIKLAKKVS
jgi:O-antigen ligase